MSLPAVLAAGGLFVVLLAAAILILRSRTRAAERAAKPIIGFLHPFCNDGGGGERVLWVGVRDIIARYGDNLRIVVYTGDAVNDADIRAHTQSRFGVSIPSEVVFVRLALRGLRAAARLVREPAPLPAGLSPSPAELLPVAAMHARVGGLVF